MDDLSLLVTLDPAVPDGVLVENIQHDCDQLGVPAHHIVETLVDHQSDGRSLCQRLPQHADQLVADQIVEGRLAPLQARRLLGQSGARLAHLGDGKSALDVEAFEHLEDAKDPDLLDLGGAGKQGLAENNDQGIAETPNNLDNGHEGADDAPGVCLGEFADLI